MKKLTSVLSVLLAAALVAMAMPVAQAAQVSLQAGGSVLQIIPANEDPSVILAKVTEGGLDWSDLANLSVFSSLAGGYLRPGTAGSYPFTLHNEYSLPIKYTFTYEVAPGSTGVPVAYKVNGSPLPAGGLTGTVPAKGSPGDSLPFTLDWVWGFDDGTSASDPLGIDGVGMLNGDGYSDDNVLGAQSRQANRLGYKVTLKFVIEAEEKEKDYPPPPLPYTITLIWYSNGVEVGRWEGLPPNTTIGEALQMKNPDGSPKYAIPPLPNRDGYTFEGFFDPNGKMIVDKDGKVVDPDYVIEADAATGIAIATLEIEAGWEEEGEKEKCEWPDWLLPGIVSAGGLIIGGLTIPWLLALPAIPVLGAVGWLLHRHCVKNCGKPLCKAPDGKAAAKIAPVAPPKTGDSLDAALLAGLGLALATGVLALTQRKRKREAVV